MDTEGGDPLFIDGVWEVINVLGSGGNGKVYHFQHTNNDDEAVIKSASRNNIANVNAAFDALEEADNPVGFPIRLHDGTKTFNPSDSTVMMTLLGETPQMLMDQHKDHVLSLRPALGIGMQVLRRIQQLHELGFLHRDVKSDNFVLGRQWTPDVRTVHLVDFGHYSRFMTTLRGGGVKKNTFASTKFETLLSGSLKHFSLDMLMHVKTIRRTGEMT